MNPEQRYSLLCLRNAEKRLEEATVVYNLTANPLSHRNHAGRCVCFLAPLFLFITQNICFKMLKEIKIFYLSRISV
ncbi:hypothetical protein T10_11273 [Trichinella papuae]|uniref:Uncharacterized protein n=1 Tax=Trichinella papuae TaxID=268474 RepID=A0A0V1M4V1_9BILA|nr:hypothetical protein T10_11273 [Trichinella papuae]